MENEWSTMRSTRLSKPARARAALLAAQLCMKILFRVPCTVLVTHKNLVLRTPTRTRASDAPCRSQRSHVTEYDAPQAHTQYLAHDMNIRRDNQEYATPVLRRCARQPCAA